MLNMWFVDEGARIEAWKPLCEVQSDKAAVEITSHCAGVVKKLYAQPNDYVKTGTPLVDIDDGIPEETSDVAASSSTQEPSSTSPVTEDQNEALGGDSPSKSTPVDRAHPEDADIEITESPAMATPAVRGLLKELNVEIRQVVGTGKDGRVLKEDVDTYLHAQSVRPSWTVSRDKQPQTESPQPLSPVQQQMFQTMTKSLSIPHFLYTDQSDITTLSSLRKRLNKLQDPATPKLTLLPFIIKAVSLSLVEFSLLNARLDTADATKPQLIHRSRHNIGVAIDTPSGLMVPVIQDVANLSIQDIASEIQHLSSLAQARKLSPSDLAGGTITVSNIGNIGGGIVAPILVEGQLAILGIGKAKPVPVFGDNGSIQKAEMVDLNWSADHRVVDGATMARMGNQVKQYLEEPERLLVQLR